MGDPAANSSVRDANDQNFGAPNPRHLNTVVVGFVDGHVKSMQMSQFYTGGSNYLNPAVGGP